ncbi:3-deoxy-7-phosphoheptulonate synthase [Candidatus Woesearchaeota archaeon]|nr:3-deoxy-7-phosphoheptulonate synthase [Candidatus Woesearchaeota archaeon]
MIIVLRPGSTDADIKHVEKKVHEFGLRAHVSKGEFVTIIGAIGDERKLNVEQLKAIPCIENVLPVLKPYKLASREFKKEDTVVDVNGARIGGGDFAVIAGPCAVESEEQYLTVARKVRSLGLNFLRGSIFKPRTSPYDFQGIREEGSALLKKAKKETGLAIVTEVMDVRQVELLADAIDIFQIGSRNMQNFDLLKEVGRTDKPVLLKRGMSATVKEFLLAAEYVMSEGNHKVILCERGIKTFETATRNTLDISAVPVVKRESHLPIIIDPSHSTGDRNYILPIARAALAVGADGLILEVHPEPEKALCDGAQSITLQQLEEMAKQLRELAPVLGRRV